MNLSPRQIEFLNQLLDLCHSVQSPVHYADVADALHVKPVTAYEMLRLLEEKGLVTSEMMRPHGHRGRSMVVFQPTARASAVLNELVNTPPSLDEQEWQAVKTSILTAVEQGQRLGPTDYQELLDALLLRIPERTSPLLFAADMITAIILVFYQLRDAAASRKVFSQLRRFGPPGWAVLYSLAGVSLVLSLVEKANRRATSLLLSYSQQFREHLDHLAGRDKTRLSDFVYEVMRALGL
jgi:DNA-binding PadR family transcriptional regulator